MTTKGLNAMRDGIWKQFQDADFLTKTVVLFWPVWFVCVGLIVLSLRLHWEPPLVVVALMVIAPVLMLAAIILVRSRQEQRRHKM